MVHRRSDSQDAATGLAPRAGVGRCPQAAVTAHLGISSFLFDPQVPAAFVLILSSFIIFERHVQAQVMPVKSAISSCKSEATSEGGGFSTTMFRRCMENEKVARQELEPLWDRLPPIKKMSCLQTAESGDNSWSYVALLGCTEKKLDTTVDLK